jgi:hypothetical protein
MGMVSCIVDAAVHSDEGRGVDRVSSRLDDTTRDDTTMPMRTMMLTPVGMCTETPCRDWFDSSRCSTAGDCCGGSLAAALARHAAVPPTAVALGCVTCSCAWKTPPGLCTPGGDRAM